MRIWMLSNRHPKCGIAEYGRDLARELRKKNEVVISDGPMPAGYDVALINWHNGRLTVEPEHIKQMHQLDMKVAVILHNSWEGVELGSPEDDILACADLVIAHEPMEFRPEPNKFVFIPHGVPELKEPPKEILNAIGTGGIQTEWKNFDLVQKVAQGLGQMGVLVDWGMKDSVVKTLSMSLFNIFWHTPKTVAAQLGQSGSVLLGVAARRPMIISDCRKFRVLLENYANEFYVAKTEDDVYNFALDIVHSDEASRRKPDRSATEMTWPIVAEEYNKALWALTHASSLSY